MNRKGALFDLDGVLIDSMPFHYQAWREAFGEFHISIAREEIYEREGERRAITANELYTKHTGEEASADLIGAIIKAKDRIHNGIFRVQFISGALELMALLKSRNVKVGLVTGATSLDCLFRGHKGFLQTFDAIVDGDLPTRGKPAPDPYVLGVQKLGVLNEDCCVVENAPLGIRSAIAANLTCFCVKGPSPLSEETLKAAGATEVYDDLEELKSPLLKFFSSDD